MSSHVWIVILLSIWIVTSGCRREDRSPELSDKIYLDLKNEVQAGTQALDEIRKNLAESEKKFNLSAPRTLDRRTTKDDITKYSAAIERATEYLEYSNIRLSRRYAEVRRNYKIAFQAEKPWPDTNEYEYYKINKKLVNAPKSWNTHLVSDSQAAKIETKANTGSEKTPD